MEATPDSRMDGARDGLGADDFLTRVLDAVGATSWPGLGFQAEPRGQTFATRMLASVLVLAYARGVLSSEEVSEACRSVPELVYLCSGDVPESRVFRRFRRHHAAALAEALARVWTANQDGICTTAAASEQARQCLEAAVAADSLALDF
jgi:hypothetical protein